MDYIVALYLLADKKIWDKVSDTFPKSKVVKSLSDKMYPKRLIKASVKKYGCLINMWEKFGLKY